MSALVIHLYQEEALNLQGAILIWKKFMLLLVLSKIDNSILMIEKQRVTIFFRVSGVLVSQQIKSVILTTQNYRTKDTLNYEILPPAVIPAKAGIQTLRLDEKTGFPLSRE